MPKSPNDGGWLLQTGVKDNDQVGASLPILYKYRFDLNQPAVAGRSLDPSDIANLADFQRVVGLVAGQGLDWPTMQALQHYDRISLHWENALPGGLRLDIGAMQWALARIGLMGDWDWWSGVGTHGPRTAEAINRFYDKNASILGKGDGKIGPKGFGLLAQQAGTFKCTTPYAEVKPQALPSTGVSAPASRYVRPCDPQYPLSARYGQRGRYWSKGRNAQGGLHTGEDIAAPQGANIYATIGGKVISTVNDRAYGQKIIIRGDDGLDWWYCHTSKRLVSYGQRVKTGQRIGLVGSTGNVSGPHLHLECRPAGGGFGNDLNPNRWP